MTADPMARPEIVTLADGLYARVAVDNMGWVDLGDGAVVVDALEHPHLEQEVFDAMTSTLGDTPVRYVLNTHPHGDHVALNAAFQRRWGAEVINLRTHAMADEGRWFEGPKRRLLMQPMIGCHTQYDAVMWVPEDKVLFVGDIFGWGLINLSQPLNADTAKLVVDTHERLIEFGAETVVPGHGPLCTPAELRRWVEYFEDLHARVLEARVAGKTDAEIKAEIAPPEDMTAWWRFVQWKHADSLDKILAAVRGGWTAR